MNKNFWTVAEAIFDFIDDSNLVLDDLNWS